MKAQIKTEDGKIQCTFTISEEQGVAITIRLSPSEARNFKARLDAELKSLESK